MHGDAIKDWKLEGRLHLWRYTVPDRNMPGWHLNADALACQSIAALIDLLLAAPQARKTRIPVSVPARIWGAPPSEWESAPELLLIYPKDTVYPAHWVLEHQKDKTLSLALGAEKLQAFKKSLLGLPDWKDDFALGPEVNMNRKADRNLWDKQCLWFWTKIA